MTVLRRTSIFVVVCICLSVFLIPQNVLASSFVDVPDEHWAVQNIESLVSKKILNGYDNGDKTFSFRPDKNITRAEFVTILVKAFNKYDEEAKNPFKDVSDNAWYRSAVASAFKEKLTSGISDTEFGAEQFLTREQMMTFNSRAMVKYLYYTLPTESEASDFLSTFTDGETVSPWAKKAVALLIKEGIVNGYDLGDGRKALYPQKDISRAEVSIVTDKTLKLEPKEGWTYSNGGDDYIIKSNGIETIKIPIDISDIYDYYRKNVGDLTEITVFITARVDFYALNGWIYFYESCIVSFNDNDSRGSSTWDGGFYKIKEDGTQRKKLGDISYIIGYDNNYIFYTTGYGNTGSYDGSSPVKIFRAELKDDLIDLNTKREYLNCESYWPYVGDEYPFDYGSDYYNEHPYIEDGWIYFWCFEYDEYDDGGRYEVFCKIKTDGTQLTEISRVWKAWE